MKIVLCNQKGGSGKTTLTLLLAMALESVGRKIGISDRDPQRTSSRAITHLRAENHTTIHLASHNEYSDIEFIDSAPRLDETLATAIGEGDKVILVSSPSPADLWSTQESRDFVLKNLKPGAKCAVLFNNINKSAKISRDLELLAGHIGMQALQSYITRRQAFQYAILQGWGILKGGERDEIRKAALEIGTL